MYPEISKLRKGFCLKIILFRMVDGGWRMVDGGWWMVVVVVVDGGKKDSLISLKILSDKVHDK